MIKTSHHIPSLCLLSLALSSWATPVAAGDWFVDVASKVGIDFQHQDARFGAKYYIETAASGGGWIDYDDDGDLDLYLINGAATPGSSLTGTARNHLYENRGGRFVDVTAAAGVGDTGYGMGFCVGDVDGDGRLDFLVTNYGPDRLYRQRPDGTFEDVAPRLGVADERWGASCAFADLDADGDLDLYVTHYVDFAFERNPFCGDRARDLRAYCRPEAFAGVTDSLFIQQQDGTFVDQAKARGIAEGVHEKGFGVVASDIDNDGDTDLYVANDGTMNRLYVNDGSGHFEDQALFSGTGLSHLGAAESGMGVDLGDADGDGRLDLMVTNYSMETNTLYRNGGALLFDDVTQKSGLGEPSYKHVGWGVQFFDYDNDGDLDVAVANGHAVDNIEVFEAGLHYRQPNQLYENTGGGVFREVSAQAGKALQVAKVSRGLAVGDYDNDGRLDLMITNTNEGIDLLHNRVDKGHHWLGVKLVGPKANRAAIGARVTLIRGDRRWLREVRSGGSFMAQSDLRLHFGLGPSEEPVELDIQWPDGTRQKARSEQLDRYWSIDYAPSTPPKTSPKTALENRQTPKKPSSPEGS